jgi:hypothetical protein
MCDASAYGGSRPAAFRLYDLAPGAPRPLIDFGPAFVRSSVALERDAVDQPSVNVMISRPPGRRDGIS